MTAAMVAWRDTDPHHPDTDPRWRDNAACRDTDPALWFPPKGDSRPVDDARAICATCPVAQPCLAYAVATVQAHGIWAGTTERERRQIRRDGTPVTPPERATDPYKAHAASIGNHQRWHTRRGITKTDCRWCQQETTR